MDATAIDRGETDEASESEEIGSLDYYNNSSTISSSDNEEVYSNSISEVDSIKSNDDDEDECEQKNVDFSGQSLNLLPSSLFQKITITHLNLCGNNLRYLPPEISELVNLQWLDLSRNSLTGVSKPASKIVLSGLNQKSSTSPSISRGKSYDATGVKNLHPGSASLPMEMKVLEQLQYLNVSECNLKVVPPVIFELFSLRHLNLSRNSLHEIPSLIGQLHRLRTLNLNQTRITTVPAELVCCKNLRFLNVFGNKITNLPSLLSGLVMLKRFWIDCRHFADSILSQGTASTSKTAGNEELRSVVVNNMEMLIIRGQMRSQHLPTVLFEFPNLRYLNLNGCRINNLPDDLRKSRCLNELDLSHNYFQRIPANLEDLRGSLAHLDLSHNDLHQICLESEVSSPEIGNLLPSLQWLALNNCKLTKINLKLLGLCDRLQYLDLSHNHLIISLSGRFLQICDAHNGYIRISSDRDKCLFFKITEIDEDVFINNLHAMQTFSIRANALTKLPDSVCNMLSLKNLDLGDNRLINLPNKFYRLKNLQTSNSYRGLYRAGLWLVGNPLTLIHKNIWQNGTTRILYRYLQTREMRFVKNLQPLKITLLGQEGSGKSTLLNRLVGVTQKSNHISLNDPTKNPEEDVLWDYRNDQFERSNFLTSFNGNLPFAYRCCQSPNGLNYIFLEFPDKETFSFVQPHLLDQKSMIWLLVDIEKVLNGSLEIFDEILGRYLELLQAYIPGAPVRIVLTQADKLSELDNIKRNIKFNQNISDHLSSSDQENEPEVENSILSKILRKIVLYLEESQPKLNIYPSITLLGQNHVDQDIKKPLSNRNILKYWFDIERLTLEEPLFNNRHYYATQTWSNFRKGILNLYPNTIILSLKQLELDYNPLLKNLQYIPKGKELEDCLEHWNSVGLCLWWRKHPKMKEYLVLRPSLFALSISRLTSLPEILNEEIFKVIESIESRGKLNFLRAVTKVGIQSVKKCFINYNSKFEIAFATLKYLMPQESLQMTKTVGRNRPGTPSLFQRPATVLGTREELDAKIITNKQEVLNKISVVSETIKAYEHFRVLLNLLQCGVDIRNRQSLVINPTQRGEEYNITLHSVLVAFPYNFTKFLSTLVIEKFDCAENQRIMVKNCVAQYNESPQMLYERIFSSLANEISTKSARPILVQINHPTDENLAFNDLGRKLNIETRTSRIHLTELYLSSTYRFAMMIQVEYSKIILHRIMEESPDSQEAKVEPIDPISIFIDLVKNTLEEINGNLCLNFQYPVRMVDIKT